MTTKSSESSVRTLERGLEILLAFEYSSSDFSLTELAQKVDLSPSTASRLLASLEKYHFVRRSPETRRYSLGFAFLHLSGMAQLGNDLRTLALPFLKKLQQTHNESASLYVVESDSRVCLERVESTHPLRRNIMIGETLPLTRGAGGRVLLAWLSKEEQKEILAKQTGTSIEVLEGVRKAGYAVSHSEREAGVFAVSAPIFNDKKRVVAALSMSGPTSRLTRELEIKYIKSVCQTAKQLSKELGYS
jgi:IclR family KDG regulon transcriptional repressor